MTNPKAKTPTRKPVRRSKAPVSERPIDLEAISLRDLEKCVEQDLLGAGIKLPEKPWYVAWTLFRCQKITPLVIHEPRYCGSFDVAFGEDSRATVILSPPLAAGFHAAVTGTPWLKLWGLSVKGEDSPTGEPVLATSGYQAFWANRYELREEE